VTRVAFVYPNSRRELIAEIAAGVAPDTALLGQNHLHEHGIDALVHEPRVTAAGGSVRTRVAWHARALLLALELADVDVVVTPLANLLPLLTRLRRRPRVVVLNFGLNTILRRARAARRALLGASLRSAHVVCLGDSQRAELEELVPRLRASTAPFGVDERFFRPPRERPPEPLLLSVGRDLARDYRTLGAAVDGLDVRVVVVAHERNLAGVRLPGNVEVQSGLSHVELRDLYARATCVAVPLRRPEFEYGSEGAGLTALLEAAATALPVVATARPIFRDYLGDAKITVPPEDPAALREALERELASGDGAAARAAVEQHHTTRAFAAALAPLIESG
jgi:glycosyltransferase involved in cell wall biosynthesis